MKLKFMVVDKSQNGFARHCPTFAKIRECLTDKLNTMRLRRLVREYQESNKAQWYVAGMPLNELRNLAEKGIDISIAIPILRAALRSTYSYIIGNAAVTLESAAANEKTRGKAIAALADASDHATDITKNIIYRTLANIAFKFDITSAIPALITAFDSRDEIGDANLSLALLRAVMNKTSQHKASLLLVDALRSSSENVQIKAASVLKKAALEGDYGTIRSITATIMLVTQSKDFMYELERNSPIYVERIRHFSQILSNANFSEPRWARGSAQ